jgi:hypothetical protein
MSVVEKTTADKSKEVNEFNDKDLKSKGLRLIIVLPLAKRYFKYL